jgi:hypothetical protein
MASPSEILGLFTSPQQYQTQQQDLARARAMEYAKLTPLQRAETAIGQGAYNLAGAIGGALGGVDPQLQKITMRQQLASQLDQSNPESFMQVAQLAAQNGDPEFAMALADAGRKAQSEINLAQQRGAEKMTKEQRNAIAYASQFGTPDSIEYKEAYQQRFDELTLKAGKENKPFEFEAKEARLQDLKSALRVQRNQPTQNKEAIQRLEDSIQAIEGPAKPEPRPSVGSDREAIALDIYDKNYYDLTPSQRTEVNKRVDAKKIAEAKATAPLPGVKNFQDIPKLRSDILGVVKPFRDAVNATDNALESLDLSINQNNFIAFNAARVQLAKALAGGDLSQKEIAAAGGDPSILGSLIDTASTAFTGTPSLETQKKIKDTINAIQKVALKKGNAELSSQRVIAKRSGFNEDDFNAASDIPEFKSRKKKKTITLKSGKTVTVEED